MKKKRVMIIGARGSGKTSIANKLNHVDKIPNRCQDVIYGLNTIDIPSAYIENSWMYKNLIALSQDAYCILVVVSTKGKNEIFSYGFAKVFTKKVIGVINKEQDFIDEKEALNTLKLVGVDEPYFRVNSKIGEGIQELEEYLMSIERG